jgi:molecular chaperone DnaJ
MSKNFYGLLDIDDDASQAEIKSAYRKQVKKLHPDHYGQDCEPFLAVQKAYETLSDPSRRSAYDAQLARERRRATKSSPSEPPSWRVRRRPSGARPASAFDDTLFQDFFRFFGSPFDEMWDRLWSDFAPPGRPRIGGLEQLEVEIALTPEEAWRGGQVRIPIPIPYECPACRGRGSIGPYACRHCSGQGAYMEDHAVLLTFPGGVAEGHSAGLPLDSLGLHNVYLTVHFTVRPDYK